MSKLNILIGADPEVFMRKDGVLVSAHGAVQGTKAAPFKVMQGAVQVDGMALEFNIDPASSSEEFVNNIQTVMAELARMVPGYELVADPVAEFGLDYIKAQPRKHRRWAVNLTITHGWVALSTPSQMVRRVSEQGLVMYTSAGPKTWTLPTQATSKPALCSLVSLTTTLALAVCCMTVISSAALCTVLLVRFVLSPMV